MNYSPLTNADREEMLRGIGVKNFEELIANIPSGVANPPIDVPAGMSEWELSRYLGDILSLNRNTQKLNSFLGAGSYDHYVPSVVRHILGRGEFYTAYTPYQAEASQGTLQAIFEYQSMISELLGMDAANGSHYDGATAFAEGVLLALKVTQRNKVLIAKTVNPEYRAVAKTYLAGTDHLVEEIPFNGRGAIDVDGLKQKLSPDVGCVCVSNPNFLGLVEGLAEVADLTHKNQSLFLVTGHPMSYSVFRSPGEWGADIACGDAQPLGLDLNFGGPYVGYFATTRALVRRMPGRLVGITRDHHGNRCFVLTLQAREQHIRREKASSNICSNQALCALAVCVYFSTMGWDGIREAAMANIAKANRLRTAIEKLKDFEIPFGGTVFNEIVVRSRKPLKPVFEKLARQGVLPGLMLEKYYTELKDCLLVAVTEKKSDAEIDRLVDLLKSA